MLGPPACMHEEHACMHVRTQRLRQTVVLKELVCHPNHNADRPLCEVVTRVLRQGASCHGDTASLGCGHGHRATHLGRLLFFLHLLQLLRGG
jgi:hypothetical protein